MKIVAKRIEGFELDWEANIVENELNSEDI